MSLAVGASVPKIIFIANLFSTAYMCGVIWYVQVVHYPIFDNVGNECFVEYERRTVGRTARVVVPPMLIELATTAALLWWRPQTMTQHQAWLGAALLALVWLNTFAQLVPLHGRLALGWNAEVHRNVVRRNWIRTLAWSGRTLLLIAVTWQMLRG